LIFGIILRVRYVVGASIRHPRVKSACLFRNAVDEFLQDETLSQAALAVVGGTIIDGASATFDRILFPSLPDSFVSRLRRSPIAPPYVGTCTQAVCEGKRVTCPTFPLKHVSMPGGVVCTSTLASNRCNPLPYSALTGRLLVPSLWHSMSQRPPLPSTSN
jgi:hypothetical protein